MKSVDRYTSDYSIEILYFWISTYVLVLYASISRTSQVFYCFMFLKLLLVILFIISTNFWKICRLYLKCGLRCCFHCFLELFILYLFGLYAFNFFLFWLFVLLPSKINRIVDILFIPRPFLMKKKLYPLLLYY